jgi:hypothetical protein
MKIRAVGAEFFRADGQNVSELMVAFRNFSNTPKNGPSLCCPCHVACFGLQTMRWPYLNSNGEIGAKHVRLA